MFDEQMTAAASKEQTLAELRRRIEARSPASLRTAPIPDRPEPEWGGGVLPTDGPFAEVLPRGGLPLGGVVSIEEPPGGAATGGATSLLLCLLAGPADRWSALVGRPDVGLLAAAELGVDLDHLVVIPDPGSDVLQVISVLSDGVDLIAAAEPPGGWGPPGRRRVITGRLRQHGTVLLVAGRWPGADLVLTARQTGWGGIGRGHGRLRDRELVVTVGGRRAAGGHPAEQTILLTGRRDGTVAATVTGSDAAATGGARRLSAAVPTAV